MSNYHDRIAKVVIGGSKINLSAEITQTQFMVLSCLNMHFDEFVGVQYLAEKCAPRSCSYLQDWTARAHIVQIRKALAGTGFTVINLRSKGYKLTLDDCKER